jgi:hypothetical protein
VPNDQPLENVSLRKKRSADFTQEEVQELIKQ